MMRAPDLHIQAGRSYRFKVGWKNRTTQDGQQSMQPVNITNCQMVCEIRSQADKSLIARADSNGNGIDILNAEDALVSVCFSPETTKGQPATKLGEAVYELMCRFPSGDAYSVVRGLVAIEPEIIPL